MVQAEFVVSLVVELPAGVTVGSLVQSGREDEMEDGLVNVHDVAVGAR